MASPKRDHLVDTALDLFCREGFHATGIDRILDEAGVARMTLYNHFKSKDELILATLRLRDERFRDWFVDAVERAATAPRERLIAIFDALGEWFAEENFSGCMFINASAEFAPPDDPIHAAAAEHKLLMRGYIRDQAMAAGLSGAAEADSLADGLMLLAEGAIVMAYVVGDGDAAAKAKAAAAVLLRDAGL